MTSPSRTSPRKTGLVERVTPSRRVRLARIIVAAAATVAALVLAPAAAPVAQADVRNCTDLTRHSPACYELVWVNGVQVKMTFSQSGNPRPGNARAEVNSFYVIAPQTGEVQGTAPFLHDHTVGVSPSQNRGPSVFWHGYFVVCSATGISTGRCVPVSSVIPGLGSIPLAESVDGQKLTSVDVIESYVNSGLLTLIDTGAEYIGAISPGH
jgi:hypothetical protein